MAFLAVMVALLNIMVGIVVLLTGGWESPYFMHLVYLTCAALCVLGVLEHYRWDASRKAKASAKNPWKLDSQG